MAIDAFETAGGLVEQLKAREAGQSKAAVALWHLAQEENGRQAAIGAGAVKVLLELLPAPLQETSSSLELLPSALGALASLALHPEARQVLRQEGGELKVAGLLLQPPSPEVLLRAVHLVESLALDRECREALRKLGAVPPLVDALTSESAGCVSAAAGALKCLSTDEESQAEISRRDGLEVLVELLGHPDEHAACKAAECIGNFAMEQAYRVRLRSLEAAGALLNLLDVLERSASAASSGGLQIGPTAALMNLCVDDECKAAVLRHAAGLHRLLSQLSEGTEAPLRLVSIMVLANLSTQADCAAAIAEKGGALALAQCLTANDAQLREKASAALRSLALGEDSWATLLEEEVLLRVLSSLDEESSAGPHCLDVARALAEKPKGRSALLRQGAVAQLLLLLDLTRPLLAEGAAGTIWNLCNEESARHEVASSGGLASLISLLASEGAELAQRASGALALLAEEQEIAEQILTLDAVPALLALLVDPSTPGAENSVHVLVAVAEQLEKKPQEANGAWSDAPAVLAEALRRRRGGSGSTQLCVAAWLVCQGHEARRRAFSAAGGLSELCLVLDCGAEEALLEAATGAVRALCEGCPENQDAFAEAGGLQRLTPLLEHGRLEVRLNAAKALCSAAESESLQRKIDQLGVVERVREILGLD
eukprot:TRINITY_DN79825_c0_g1_i1.p1 TRINITY_DN79825_c0_g1~~TRINITY_DN79825_c0_g1_i1.p1  ORF type:complete len:657 (-),score=175.63 TRINITY_DN79825_c0_g1_i1:43-2013(-)